MFRNKTRKIAGVIVSLAVGISLLGVGVFASFSDNGSATEKVAVGGFGITVTSGAAGAVVVNSGTVHTVTLDAGTLMKSDAGSVPLPFTVTSTGSIPANIHVAVAPPIAPFSSLLNPPADTVLNGVAQKQDYAGGLKWPELVNADLGKSATVVYTITASESPYVPPMGTMTHIGSVYTIRVNTAPGGGAIPPGAILATYHANGYPTGWSNGWAGLGPHTGGLAVADASGVIYWTGTDADIGGTNSTGPVQFSVLSTPTTLFGTLTPAL